MPSLDLYWPGAHEAHDPPFVPPHMPALLYVPLGQENPQPLQLLWLPWFWNWPEGQPLQPPWALWFWYWPEGQPLQPLWVLWFWYWPPGHAWHDVWPWLLLPM